MEVRTQTLWGYLCISITSQWSQGFSSNRDKFLNVHKNIVDVHQILVYSSLKINVKGGVTMVDEFDRYLLYQKEIAEAKLKIIDRLQKSTKGKPQKRTSQINIAWHVLRTAGRPLHVSELIEIAKRDFNEELERDSIVSAILKKASAGRMFIRTAPNTFAAKQE
jgi:hypothetical protein